MFIPKMLIAEPDPAEAASFARQFRASGWQVWLAADAVEVESAAVEHRPDMVLLDIEMGGLALLERLRERRETRDILVAVMSSRDDTQLRQQATVAGAFVFLTKPLKLQSVTAIKKLVQHRNSAPRVLISDDDVLMVRSLERAARSEGFEPVSETDASHVVHLAKQVQPQVIVLDINQVNLDGRDVLAQLKKDPATRNIKVVMLTGIEDQLTRHDCLILGADDYVVKPLDPLFFVRIARKLAEQPLN